MVFMWTGLTSPEVLDFFRIMIRTCHCSVIRLSLLMFLLFFLILLIFVLFVFMGTKTELRSFSWDLLYRLNSLSNFSLGLLQVTLMKFSD